MKAILTGLAALVVLAFAAAIYVRLAPLDAARFHQPGRAEGPGDETTMNSFAAARRITTTPEGVLRALDAVARAAPRTEVLAGSVEDGRVTYVTRSRLMGYPDMTTAEVIETAEGPLLSLRGQSRFGKSDLGVNRARVVAWLAALGPLVEAP